MFRDKPRTAWQRRLALMCANIQNRLWKQDEDFAAEHGYESRRISSGWGISIRDPRWGSRRCAVCAGRGVDTEGQQCGGCHGTGVSDMDLPDAQEHR